MVGFASLRNPSQSLFETKKTWTQIQAGQGPRILGILDGYGSFFALADAGFLANYLVFCFDQFHEGSQVF